MPQPSFSILCSLFSVLFALSHVCTPHPCLPLSIPTVIARPCPYHLSSPSPPPHHVNTPIFDTNTPASTLLPVTICAFSNLQDCGLSPSPSLSVTWGTSLNLACRHCSALQSTTMSLRLKSYSPRNVAGAARRVIILITTFAWTLLSLLTLWTL